MDANANSLMGILNSMERNLKTTSINQNFANNSMRKANAHMVTDACSDTNKEASTRSTTTYMFRN